MKKTSMLAALALVATIGGAYATWMFAEETSPAASTTVNVAMTGVSSKTEKGTLNVMVMGENGFTLALDDANNDHVAEIKKTGYVTVTFQPSASASQDVKTNGIKVQCAISYAPYTGGPTSLEEWKYNGTQIFDIGGPIILNSTTEWYSKGDNMFSWTIPADEIAIALKNNFLIDTLEKYNGMNAELAKGHFVLTVSEYIE